MKEKKFYVIETDNINKPDEPEFFEISSYPAITNMSHEEKIQGWLGTTGNLWSYAHGIFNSIEDARAFIKSRMSNAIQLDLDELDDEDTIEIWGIDPESIWDVADWYENIDLDDLEIDENTPESEIEKIAERLEEETNGEGITLIGDSIFDYLVHRQKDL